MTRDQEVKSQPIRVSQAQLLPVEDGSTNYYHSFRVGTATGAMEYWGLFLITKILVRSHD